MFVYRTFCSFFEQQKDYKPTPMPVNIIGNIRHHQRRTDVPTGPRKRQMASHMRFAMMCLLLNAAPAMAQSYPVSSLKALIEASRSNERKITLDRVGRIVKAAGIQPE